MKQCLTNADMDTLIEAMRLKANLGDAFKSLGFVLSFEARSKIDELIQTGDIVAAQSMILDAVEETLN